MEPLHLLPLISTSPSPLLGVLPGDWANKNIDMLIL